MKYIGIDLHKRIIVICVLNDKREIVKQKKFTNQETEEMREWFESQKPFEAVFEATASYDWFYALLEPIAKRVVLAHPKKMRIIAESKKKSDKMDAYFLAKFLALGEIPEAHCPSPYIKGYRQWVRLRHKTQSQITSVKNRLRNLLSKSNRDRRNVFTQKGRAWLKQEKWSVTDHVQITMQLEQLDMFQEHLKRTAKEIRAYVKQAPHRIQEAQEILQTIPGVGAITADVVVSELGDINRFPSQKEVCSYAGLVPGRRQSAEREKNLPITKEGSKILRWAMVEAAWRVAQYSQKWKRIHEELYRQTRNKKKANVAVARKLLCVMSSMLRSGSAYSPTA